MNAEHGNSYKHSCRSDMLTFYFPRIWTFRDNFVYILWMSCIYSCEAKANLWYAWRHIFGHSTLWCCIIFSTIFMFYMWLFCMQWFYGTLHYSWTSLLRSQTFKYNASVKRGGPTGRNYIEEEEDSSNLCEGHSSLRDPLKSLCCGSISRSPHSLVSIARSNTFFLHFRGFWGILFSRWKYMERGAT